jgi:hypothetical protein
MRTATKRSPPPPVQTHIIRVSMPRMTGRAALPGPRHGPRDGWRRRRDEGARRGAWSAGPSVPRGETVDSRRDPVTALHQGDPHGPHPSYRPGACLDPRSTRNGHHHPNRSWYPSARRPYAGTTEADAQRGAHRRAAHDERSITDHETLSCVWRGGDRRAAFLPALWSEFVGDAAAHPAGRLPAGAGCPGAPTPLAPPVAVVYVRAGGRVAGRRGCSPLQRGRSAADPRPSSPQP